MACRKGDDSAQRRREKPSNPPLVADSGQRVPPVGDNGKTDPDTKTNGKTDPDTKLDGKNDANAKPDNPGPGKTGDVPSAINPKSTKQPTWSAAPPSTKKQTLGKLVSNDAWRDLAMQNPAGINTWQLL